MEIFCRVTPLFPLRWNIARTLRRSGLKLAKRQQRFRNVKITFLFLAGLSSVLMTRNDGVSLIFHDANSFLRRGRNNAAVILENALTRRKVPRSRAVFPFCSRHRRDG